ncbi:MAG TPA: SGNH/GDSL hydrolase family protein, partial [Gemmataceae bacterium]|nr:SGNH/GDSL hydrolase family protein [Gemmataceae bacterium]
APAWIGTGSLPTAYGTASVADTAVFEFNSKHTGMIQFSMGDGSVRGIRKGIAPGTTAYDNYIAASGIPARSSFPVVRWPRSRVDACSPPCGIISIVQDNTSRLSRQDLRRNYLRSAPLGNGVRAASARRKRLYFACCSPAPFRYNRFTAFVPFLALIGRAVIVKSLFLPLFVCCSLGILAPAYSAEKFSLRDGDRVVLVGSTLIEREQRYGYWETALTRRYPDKSITFRNLGWSGDTVFGDARAGFGSQADGFRHLKDHVLALKPTVIIIGYGTNESFKGPKGLSRFIKGLETLLDALAPTKARIVLLSPLKQENLGSPLPDPKENNKNLRLYADAIRDVAKKRDHLFLDLFDIPIQPGLFEYGRELWRPTLTDNGIHLTAWGYWYSASFLEDQLGLWWRRWYLEIGEKQRLKSMVSYTRLEEINGAARRFRLTDAILPIPPQPEDGMPRQKRVASRGRRMRYVGLPPGSYKLLIDGKKVVSATAEEWFAGVYLQSGPEFDQAERLRQAIIAKNRLYFYRWRPENETYLFGFRKHEQGQNAREIPQFDPLIAAKEKEIAKLRVPVSHTYEIKADKKK